jgi:hypothetical protein
VHVAPACAGSGVNYKIAADLEGNNKVRTIDGQRKESGKHCINGFIRH